MSTTAFASRRAFRPEIQALRALAIGGVIVLHCWPRFLPGGLVGVDVFFVISGFLITGQLVRSAGESGRIRPLAFYLRRLRRLLPSALIVIAFCATMTALFVPASLKSDFVREILGSLFYYQNWVLGLIVDGTKRDTPMTHFWSLSAEEQFYLIWPLIIILGIFVATRLGVRREKALAVAFGLVLLASFVYSLWLTATNIRLAYFSTAGRAWEFAAGGLLALVPARRIDLAPVARGILSWAGLVAIFVTMATPFDHHQFPGWIALIPVFATIAVITAGSDQPRWGAISVMKLRFVQWAGSISYSLYLWHWALVAFTPFVTGHPSPSWLVASVLLLAVALAWVTTRFVENPVRASQPLASGDRQLQLSNTP